MRLRDLSIRLKFTGVILLVSGLTLLIAALIIVGFEASAARERAVEDLRGLALLVGVNSRAALEFADPEAATENLRALSVRPDIIAAAIYASDGSVFASYSREELALPERGLPGPRFSAGNLELFQAIPAGPQAAGSVYLRANLEALEGLIARYAMIVGGAFAALLLGAAVLALLLQRGLTGPILQLARVARAVTERKDYRLRATKHGDDEVGVLTDALNQMLYQIERQNAELEARHRALQREVGVRRRAEGTVRALNAELESRVAARTEELQSANQELEAFSYSVSHDLRAPIRGIDGFSRILQEEYGPQLDAEGRRLIGIVRQNCHSMGQLIDDLLAFSRLGRKALATERVDMQELVEEVLGEFERMPGETLPEVELRPLPVVEGDRALLRQVWVNLIGNAIKFSAQAQSPKIRIGAVSEPERIVFEVSDNGVGFDMEYYDKLFGVFQRLHAVDEFPGTGVGLATVRRIIVRHGGEVWAEGRPGEGASFYFALPGE